MSLIYNATFDSQTRVLSLLDKAGNVISSCEVPSKELVDDPNKPLMLRAIEDNSYVTLKKNGMLSNTYQTSTNGKDWTDYTLGTGIRLNNEDVVYFRCSNHPTTQSYSNYVQFVMTGKVEAWHNAYSMISSDFSSAEGSVGSYGMRGLFARCESLMKAPLLLNALADHCYIYMFTNCTCLTQAPELPATTLADYCYYEMFRNCTSLVKAPALPATTGFSYSDWTYCYYGMFDGCTALNEVHVSATSIIADRHTKGWLTGVPTTGDFYCDPNASWTSGASGIPYGWKRWVYGVENTGTTTTMYHNGVAETVRVGTSSYGTCYALQGWTGFRTLAQMHALGYILQEPVPTAMYHNGSTETIGKIEANGADGFTEDMYILNSSFKTLSEMHALGRTIGAQTAITMYDYSDPVSAYSCAANVDDGFTETMYDIGDGEGYLTISQQNAKHYYLVSTEFDGLVLTATADNSSVTLTKNGTLSNTYEVSLGDGSGWHAYTLGNTINLNNGDKCLWRCSNHPTAQSSSNFVQFVMTGTIEATGDSLSMLSPDFSSLTSVIMYGLYKLFMNCTSLTKAPSIRTSIGLYGCALMFRGCTGLVNISEIPSLEASDFGAYQMFYGCTAIIDASGMSCIGSTKGESTADACCLQSMFEGCTSLVYPPSSVRVSHTPADSSLNMMARHAARMFYGCTSLCRLPTLSVSRVNYAYESMFEGCTSLTEITVPISGIYYAEYTWKGGEHSAYIKGVFKRMFAGCTGLKHVVWTPQDLTSPELYMEMFSGCSSLKEIYNFGWLSVYLTTYRSDSSSNTMNRQDYVNSGTSQYTRMFENCSSLVSIDGFVVSHNGEPLTEMFKGCTSLQYPPQIVLGTASVTYGETENFTPPSNMFLGCTSVKEVCFRKIAVNESYYIAYSDPTTMDNWLSDVSNSGVIYSSMLNNIPTNSADGVPLGWKLTDKSGDPLEFIALEDDSSIALNLNTVQPYSDDTYNYEYSRDGIAWQSYTLGDVLSANTGDSIFFRCDNIPKTAYFTTPTGLFDGRGNPTLNNSIFAFASRASDSTGDYPTYYQGLFEGTTLRSFYSDAYIALSSLFFTRMFKDCTSLTSVGGRTFIVRNVTYPSSEYTSTAVYAQMYKGCTALTSVPYLSCYSRYSRLYYQLFYGCSNLSEIRTLYNDEYTFISGKRAYNTAGEWAADVSATGNFYCYPEARKARGSSSIPSGWDIWVYGAEDTGNTATMYHNGVAETVRIGTSAWGVCISAQGWAGFRTLDQMHAIGYTFGAQTPLTMYFYDSPVSSYSVAENIEDGFTETMYDVGDGKGYLTIAQQNVNSYYLTETPFTGLTLTATVDNSSVKLTKTGTVKNTYEVNTGSGWAPYKFNTVINLNKGQSCKWRCTSHPTSFSTDTYVQFVMTGSIEASGEVYSMLSSNLIDVTTLNGYAYAFYCLFKGCTSLTSAPQLSATTLAPDCYSSMFSGCTSLTSAPRLPATTLVSYCYSNMFSGCTSLTSAPQLSATTLVSYCYFRMFYGCSNLKEVRISAIKRVGYDVLTDWLLGVSATGDFYCDPNSTIFPTSSTSGIPANWTRHALADYPNP